MVWAALGKAAMGGLKAGAKKVATNKLLNRKKKRPKKRTSGKEMSDNMMNKDNVEQKKGGALAVQPSAGLVPTAGDLAPVSTSSGESDVIIIKKQLIQVRDILKDTRTAKQAERKNLRKARQADKRKKGEDKLEKPKVAVASKAAKSGIKMPNLGLGIGNFLIWLVAGLIFNKLKDLMPALKKIGGVLKGVAGFIGGVLEKTLGFVVGFIDLAYTGIEKLREGLVAIGGEGAGKVFDKFGKLFTQLVNAGMIAALLATRVGLFKPKGPKGPKGRKPKWQKSLQKWFKKTRAGKFIRNQRAGFLKLTRKIARSRVGKIASALRPKNIGKAIMGGGVDRALKSGVKTATKLGTKGLKTATKLGTKGLKTATKLGTKGLKSVTKKLGKTGLKTGLKAAAKTGTKLATTAGKSGLKAATGVLKSAKKIISPIVKKIPFVGAFIDFALNYFVFKEPLGKSAFMAIGAGVGTWIGGMLGTLIPVPFAGTAIGAFLGGMGGDILAGVLYDALFAGKDKNKDKKSLKEKKEEAKNPKKRDKKKISKNLKIGKKTLDLSKLMGGLSNEEYTNLKGFERRILDRKIRQYASENPIKTHAAIKSNKMSSSAEGLDTKPSYGSGGFVTIENTTTYIQPVEV